MSGRHTVGRIRRSDGEESEGIDLEQRARPSWGTGFQPGSQPGFQQGMVFGYKRKITGRNVR